MFRDQRWKNARPTWAAQLKGATGLRSLCVIEHRGLGAKFPSSRMGLADFQREWPERLTLRELSVWNAFLPFELAVRGAEVVCCSQSGVILTEATSAEGVLEALLAGTPTTSPSHTRARWILDQQASNGWGPMGVRSRWATYLGLRKWQDSRPSFVWSSNL